MNKLQETRLKVVVNNLSRVDENNVPQDLTITHKAIKETVIDIYKTKMDAPIVLRVEQILNAGYANVAGNSLGADKQMEKLTEKAAIGLEVYEIFRRDPQTFVDYIEIANKGIGKFAGEGRRFADDIPVEPIRAAFMQLRKQVTTELTQIDPQQDRKQTNRARFDATIKAERFYLETYLACKKYETEREKQGHLHHFDKRMEKLTREIEPKQ
jgi:hypothetical protein